MNGERVASLDLDTAVEQVLDKDGDGPRTPGEMTDEDDARTDSDDGDHEDTFVSDPGDNSGDSSDREQSRGSQGSTTAPQRLRGPNVRVNQSKCSNLIYVDQQEHAVVAEVIEAFGRTDAISCPSTVGRARRSPRAISSAAPFLEISNATIAGIARSKALGVLVFSRMGYTMFRQHARITDVHDFKLEGSTRTRKMRAIDGYVACIGTVPLVALDNEIIAQPKFPYASLLPELLDVLRVHKLVRATP